MNRTTRFLGTAVTLTAGPLSAQTPPDTTVLETITVTATPVPVRADAVTATLTVLDGREVRTRGITSVLDALRTVPGLDVVQTGSTGGATALYLRGGESDYVKVLVDGVPVNQPGGAFDFAHLTTANVDRIEILRGPAGVLYGSDAVAGVVHVITTRGAGPLAGDLSVQAGTYGSLDLIGAVRGGHETTSYALGVSRIATDGVYAFNNEYDNTVVNGRFAVAPDDRSGLTLTLRYQDAAFHFPTDGLGAAVDRNAVGLDETTTVGLVATRRLSDRIDARVQVASNVSAIGSQDDQDDPADTLGFYAFRSLRDVRRQSVEGRVNVVVAPGVTVTGGVALERQDEQSFNESESQFGPSAGSSRADRSSRGYFLQLWGERHGFSVSAGARVDDDAAFGTFGTYRGGVAYRTPGGTKLRASLGRSFKAPTFFETFATGFVTGNPALEPERTLGWEVGAEQRVAQDRLTLRATYFDQRFDDLIQFSAADTPNFRNLTAATSRGIEVEMAVTPVPGLDAGVALTRLETEVTDPGLDMGPGGAFVAGERLLRRPGTTVSGRVGYTAERYGAGVVIHHVGDRDDRDFATFPATRVVLEAYTTVEVSAHATVVRGAAGQVALTGRVENLFDVSYVEAHGFLTRGRTIRVGATLRR